LDKVETSALPQIQSKSGKGSGRPPNVTTQSKSASTAAGRRSFFGAAMIDAD